MLDMIEKELSIHGVSIHPKGIIEIPHGGKVSLKSALSFYKTKARESCELAAKLWTELTVLLESMEGRKSSPPEGIENIFVNCLQGLKRMIFLYPGMKDFERVENALCKALCSDSDSFSYRLMSKVIEYKLALEWVGHIIAKNLYIRALLSKAIILRASKPETVAKGVHGPFANLDLPMKERVFNWSEIDEEVRGRDRDIRNQRRYKAGLEGYNDPYVNEGFVWREIKNEPFLWGKEGENPYPHRNQLWR